MLQAWLTTNLFIKNGDASEQNERELPSNRHCLEN